MWQYAKRQRTGISAYVVEVGEHRDAGRSLSDGQWFVDLYIRRNRKRKPKRIIIDADGTDDPTYGDQQLTFFHGYYDQYM
jgi:hypothetical protein